jgi:hypothetical protein
MLAISSMLVVGCILWLISEIELAPLKEDEED